MKRIVSLILAFAIVLCFAACGGNNSKTDTGDVSSNKQSNTSSKQNSTTSSEGNMTSNKPVEEDTRYRATRKPKPDGFKYKEVSILCIGDSITAGDGTPSGYRYSLFEQLYASGAKFEFVGPSRSVADTRLTSKYNAHGGVGGRKIQDITNDVNNLCKFDYDIVLVMAGRNDNGNFDGITDRYKAMIEAIIAKNPKATIYCAEVIPQKGQRGNDAVHLQLNKHLPAICEEFTKKGNKVNFVNMRVNDWRDEFFKDYVHPNEAGNKVIATQFWDAILDEVLMINDSGDSSYVEPVHVNSLSLSETKLELVIGSSKTVAATVKPDNAEVKNVLWTSSDAKIATVTGAGRITAVKEGKATITAKTLDGNIIKTCEVSAIKSNEPASTNVFTAVFNKENWTGNTDKLSSVFGADWLASACTVTSVKEVDAGNNFKISFNYVVSGNADRNDTTNYSSVKYKGCEIRIYNCVRVIDVLVNGQSIGTYNTGTTSQDNNAYIFKVINGKASLALNGEEIITGNVSNLSGSKKVELKINDLYRCPKFTSVTIDKY